MTEVEQCARELQRLRECLAWAEARGLLKLAKERRTEIERAEGELAKAREAACATTSS